MIERLAEEDGFGQHVGEQLLLLLDRLKERRLFKRVSVFPFAANQDIQGELLARFFSPRAMHERRSFASVSAATKSSCSTARIARCN